MHILLHIQLAVVKLELEREEDASHRLAQAGVSLFKIQKWMGHSDPRITMEHYAHLSPDYDAEINRLTVAGSG